MRITIWTAPLDMQIYMILKPMPLEEQICRPNVNYTTTYSIDISHQQNNSGKPCLEDVWRTSQAETVYLSEEEDEKPPNKHAHTDEELGEDAMSYGCLEDDLEEDLLSLIKMSHH